MGGRAWDWTGATGAAATWDGTVAGVVGSTCAVCDPDDENGLENGAERLDPERRIVSELQADARPPTKATRAIFETPPHRRMPALKLMTPSPPTADEMIQKHSG
jgi:hypothetical protein